MGQESDEWYSSVIYELQNARDDRQVQRGAQVHPDHLLLCPSIAECQLRIGKKKKPRYGTFKADEKGEMKVFMDDGSIHTTFDSLAAEYKCVKSNMNRDIRVFSPQRCEYKLCTLLQATNRRIKAVSSHRACDEGKELEAGQSDIVCLRGHCCDVL